MRTVAALAVRSAAFAAALLVACTDAGSASPQEKVDGAKRAPSGDVAPPLRLVRTIPLPGVRGRIDHLARDAKRGRLFVAALGNGTVEVVSLAKGERERSIGGLEEPQGIAFPADADLLVVACGGDGSVRLFRGEDLAPAATVRLGADADNVRWVGATKRLWVAHGEGALAAIDPAKPDEPAAAVPLDVHPEGFQVDAAGGRAFVNQAARAEVAVCDLAARKVPARWPLGGPTKNYPMALDEAAKRLWIGCRAPAKLVVLSTEDGAIVASLDCAGDPDDVFVDAANRRAYVVCGEGSVDVADFAGEAPRRTGRVATRKGARTGLLDDGRLWVAVPATDAAEAEIREFEPLPR